MSLKNKWKSVETESDCQVPISSKLKKWRGKHSVVKKLLLLWKRTVCTSEGW
jgi:hypothetical protein